MKVFFCDNCKKEIHDSLAIKDGKISFIAYLNKGTFPVTITLEAVEHTVGKGVDLCNQCLREIVNELNVNDQT